MLYLNIPSVDIEAAVSIIAEIGTAVGILWVLFGIWGLFRNKRVSEFRKMVNNLSFRLAIYFLQRDNFEMVHASRQMYDKLPSYRQMLFSLRPLELEEYIDLDTYADGKIKRAMNEIDSDLPGAQNIYRAIISQENEK